MGMEGFNQDPYAGLDSLPVQDLRAKINELNQDQLSYLKAKTESAMKDPAFGNLEINSTHSEPVLVNGKTLAEYSEINAIVSQAMEKPVDYEMK